MARGNGKPEVDPVELDPEHELPAGEDGAGAGGAATEFDKLKTERDGLLDRLARLQAEFENAASAPPASNRNSASMPSPTR